MIEQTKTNEAYSLDTFIALESQVWEAFKNGDPEKDANALSDNFVGVYATGLMDKAGHCKQLENGPIVSTYEILEPQIQIIANDVVMLIYLADWTPIRAGVVGKPEKMRVSSLWQKQNGNWKNVFSQDTRIGD